MNGAQHDAASIDALDRKRAGGNSTPLDGCVVVDITRREAGAAAAFALWQLGASVIRMEPIHRSAGERRAERARDERASASWRAHERSFAVDLDAAEGRKVMGDLIEKADVFMEDCEEEMLRLGLDYGRVFERKPTLVYASLRPWASDEEFGGVASEVMLQAVTGLMCHTGDPQGPPLRTGPRYVAALSGLYLAMGVTVALLARARTNVGDHVRVVEQEVGMSTSHGKYCEAAEVEEQTRFGNGVGWGGALSNGFATKPFGPDDWCHLHLHCHADRLWPVLFRALDREDLITDARFATAAARDAHLSEMEGIVAGWMARHSKDEALKILGAAGIPIGAVWTTAEILHREYFAAPSTQEAPDGSGGRTRPPDWPVRMCASALPARRGLTQSEADQKVSHLTGSEAAAGLQTRHASSHEPTTT